MKIVLLFALVLLPLLFVSYAVAEREHIQSGQFDISFEINKNHEVGYIDDGIKIKTSNGNIEIEVLQDKSGLSSIQKDQILNALGGMAGGKTDYILIDGKDGKVIYSSKGGYVALYSPVNGYYAVISCSLPAMGTYFFLKSLQIEQRSYAQSVIAYSDNDSITSNQANQEDTNLAAQIEIDNLLGHPDKMSLSAYWTTIGDALWERNDTAAAIDAYDIAIELDPDNFGGAARFHRGMAASGEKIPSSLKGMGSVKVWAR